MQIKKYKEQFVAALLPFYDAMEIDSFFFLALEQRKQLKRIDLALQPEIAFSETEITDWNQILEKLKQFIPIQYILGKAHFYGLEFEVNQSTLIPRPETEELVAWILSDSTLSSKSSLKILDIGTGSGCIAVTLAKNLPHAHVFALDVSEKAIETAKRNAANNLVKITFLQQDILATEKLGQHFDIIVSNPPYVRNLEKAEIRQNVLDHEPHLALFVDDHDALLFYRKIAGLAKLNLAESGNLYFEINQYLGKEMIGLLEEMSFQATELRKDIYGNERMVSAMLKKA